ncbi:MAG: tRNA (adenosine(37)-N6)-threonylcarbamoyltransferase complex ATPase subunit type 1 TsaE, partial [Gammaproteobacteria bacterium]
TTSSPEETIAFGRSLAAGFGASELVFLYGNLGAGKTTLVKGIASGLGAAPEDDVNSPTYVMVQEYSGGKGGGRVYHVDLYRVEQNRDLESLGLEELLAEDAVVLVEWPERLLSSDGPPSLKVFLEVAGDTERHIRVERPAG